MNLHMKQLDIEKVFKRKRFRKERGAAAVEFAIISVLLIMIVFAVIEFGILMFDKHILTNASREGARAGIVMRDPRVSDDAIEAIVNAYAKEFMVTFGSGKLDTKVTPLEALRDITSTGDELEVAVTYEFDFLVLSGFGFGPVPLTAKTRMRIE
jgi:Flp pilus assembly protein TadG